MVGGVGSSQALQASPHQSVSLLIWINAVKANNWIVGENGREPSVDVRLRSCFSQLLGSWFVQASNWPSWSTEERIDISMVIIHRYPWCFFLRCLGINCGCSYFKSSWEETYSSQPGLDEEKNEIYSGKFDVLVKPLWDNSVEFCFVFSFRHLPPSPIFF